jgi:hypothetical protein
MLNATRALIAFTALATFAACSDSNGPDDPEPQNFTGSYTLVSFSQGTAAGVIPVPGTTGSFTMTATTYQASVTIPVPGGNPMQVDDEGTYAATGTAAAGTFTQQSTVQALQYTGTYVWDAATERLTLDTTALSVRTVLVLQKN